MNAQNNVTNNDYDASFNLTSVTAVSLNATKRFTYDVQNNITSITDARDKLTTYGYDANRNNTSVVQDGTTVETNTFNSAGQMLTSSRENRLTLRLGFTARRSLVGRFWSNRRADMAYAGSNTKRRRGPSCSASAGSVAADKPPVEVALALFDLHPFHILRPPGVLVSRATRGAKPSKPKPPEKLHRLEVTAESHGHVALRADTRRCVTPDGGLPTDPGGSSRQPSRGGSGPARCWRPTWRD
jgi:YD repeat-containing protein